MTIKGGTNKACAACKYQRRKCLKDCPLSPYFPADQPKMFQNAHRLFGVCNIMKILRQVHPEQREVAMRSIIYESNMRARFPVNGCLGILCYYRYQCEQTLEELQYVKTMLALYKEQCQYQNPQSPDPPQNFSASNSQLQSRLAPADDANIPVYHQYSQLNGGSNELLVTSNNVMYNVNGLCFEGDDQIMAKPLSGSYYGNSIVNVNPVALQGLALQQGMELCAGYDGMPFDAIADDRQSFVETKETCESSAESPFKDKAIQNMEHVSQNELKNAAADFSLTSGN